eukprot:TRINITY_DN24052_c0_g1_i1.p2 TRINITY_DN24052_c0_g1~~TRINITY_DN24052_c0_g1_i1.p2  ORF type:complete len:101 (-),score=12.28 TRINITY_DN24052_c0_g1_i1:301-603(-)
MGQDFCIPEVFWISAGSLKGQNFCIPEDFWVSVGFLEVIFQTRGQLLWKMTPKAIIWSLSKCEKKETTWCLMIDCQEKELLKLLKQDSPIGLLLEKNSGE